MKLAAWIAITAILVLARTGLQGQEVGGPGWPMYRGNSQRTGQSPFDGPHQRRIAWETNLGSEIVCAPVVGEDGTIYALAGTRLHVVSAKGRVLWLYDFAASGHSHSLQDGQGFPSASPVLAGGGLYQAIGQHSSRGNVMSLGISGEEAGRLKWACETKVKMRSSPLLARDLLVMVAGHDLLAVAEDGQPRWRVRGPYHPNSSPAISHDGDTVYAGGEAGSLHAVDLRSGERKWSLNRAADATFRLPQWDDEGRALQYFTTAGAVPEAPMMGPDGTIYFGSWDGRMYAATPEGRLRWSLDLKDRLTSAPALAADGTVVISSFEGNLHAIRVIGSTPKVT